MKVFLNCSQVSPPFFSLQENIIFKIMQSNIVNI